MGWRRFGAQHGVTLVEMMVAMGLLSTVAAVFLPLMESSMRSLRPLQAQSQAVDDLRVALASIGRELRAAECVSAPTANGPAGNQLRFTSLASHTSASYEVTYTLGGGKLHRQVTGSAGAQVVVTGLVDTGDAFTQHSTPRRTVRVRLLVQPYPEGPVRELGTIMTGRNAWRSC